MTRKNNKLKDIFKNSRKSRYSAWFVKISFRIQNKQIRKPKILTKINNEPKQRINIH